eukprot:scaffold142916_cov31-Attheya_sp.AAC.1
MRKELRENSERTQRELSSSLRFLTIGIGLIRWIGLVLVGSHRLHRSTSSIGWRVAIYSAAKRTDGVVVMSIRRRWTSSSDRIGCNDRLRRPVGEWCTSQHVLVLVASSARRVATTSLFRSLGPIRRVYCSLFIIYR